VSVEADDAALRASMARELDALVPGLRPDEAAGSWRHVTRDSAPRAPAPAAAPVLRPAPMPLLEAMAADRSDADFQALIDAIHSEASPVGVMSPRGPTPVALSWGFSAFTDMPDLSGGGPTPPTISPVLEPGGLSSPVAPSPRVQTPLSSRPGSRASGRTSGSEPLGPWTEEEILAIWNSGEASPLGQALRRAALAISPRTTPRSMAVEWLLGYDEDLEIAHAADILWLRSARDVQSYPSWLAAVMDSLDGVIRLAHRPPLAARARAQLARDVLALPDLEALREEVFAVILIAA